MEPQSGVGAGGLDLDDKVRLGRGSLEGGLHPPQRVLDPPCLSLGGRLEVGIAVRGQKVDVRGAEPGNAEPQVGLQFLVWAVGVHSLLESMYLTDHLCYAPSAKGGWVR